LKETLVARRYARGLVQALKATSRLDAVSEKLREFAALFETSREFRVALENPAIPMQAKKAVLDAVLVKLNMDSLSSSMARLALENGRIYLLPLVAEEFEEMSNSALGRIKVEITSARALSSDEEKSLKESLKKFTGKTAVMTVKEDPSLIGGVVVRIGGSVYDGSVKNQLKALKVSFS
jgi:F-type H+-transporting ATPase subunit delta